MSVYLQCFRTPCGEKATYKHAGHYLGFTARPVDARMREHQSGYGTGLTRAAVEAGLVLEVARVWPGASMEDEKRLRSRHENPRLCPLCNPEAMSLAVEVGDA